MAAALLWTHFDSPTHSLSLPGKSKPSSAGRRIRHRGHRRRHGVAGGELLIPTIVLLYGSLSLAIALPTMLVAFARYSRDQAFTVLCSNGRFVIAMTAGSIAGTLVGALLLGVVPNLVLIPALALLLLISAVKLWRH